LARINDNLARKISSRNEYDKTIQETESAYAKVRPLSP
jgi:Sjoegren syndrome nuclear autoantigen 1